jgi:hypothetical protein
VNDPEWFHDDLFLLGLALPTVLIVALLAIYGLSGLSTRTLAMIAVALGALLVAPAGLWLWTLGRRRRRGFRDRDR